MHPPASPADRPFNPVAVVMLAALAVLIFGGQMAWDAWGSGEDAGASAPAAGPDDRPAVPQSPRGATR